MYPTYLTPCPQQTQVRQAYQGNGYLLYVDTYPGVQSLTPADLDDWIVVQNGVPTNPTALRLTQAAQLNLLNPGWSQGNLDYLYYQGHQTPITLLDGATLQPFWTWLPFWIYQTPPPIRWTRYRRLGIAFFIDVDRPIIAGPNDVTEWSIVCNGSPVQPFSIYSGSTGLILYAMCFGAGTITQVTYTPGAIPYLAADGGVLVPDNFRYPFPP